MALAERVVVFHDSPPQGAGDAGPPLPAGLVAMGVSQQPDENHVLVRVIPAQAVIEVGDME